MDLSVLTARQREVIEMRYSSRLSWREIGGFLGIDHAVAIRHHHKAIKRLRDSMQGTTKHLLVGGP